MSASPNVTNDNMNFGVPSRKSVLDYATAKHDEGSWRIAIHKFFDQKWVQRTLITLLIFDIIFIFVELFLQTEYPMCYVIERDCEACCPEADQSSGRWLSGGGSYEPVCPTGYDSTGEAGCDDSKWEIVHETELALHWCTVTILVIFLIENLAEMFVLGPCKFFQQFFLAVDFVVVLASLILQLVIHEMEFGQLATILIIFRLWRFVRIGHGIVEVAAELTHDQYEELIEFAKECDKELKAKGIMPPNKSEKVEEILKEGDDHH